MASGYININLVKERIQKKITENHLAELNMLVKVSESFNACQNCFSGTCSILSEERMI